MKVICDRAALVDALNLTAGVILSRTPKPVLQCVRLQASDGVLALSATDLEAAIRISVERVDVQTPGEALIPADKLNQIARESQDATLAIEVKDDKAVIRGEDSKFTVFGYPPAEFPALTATEGVKSDFTLDAGTLRTMITRTKFATARENSRFAINGVLLKRNGKKLEFVATDSRRLALAKATCRSAAEGTATCIIPSKALDLLLKMAGDAEALVSVTLKDSQIVFSFGEEGAQGVLTSSLVEGAFPPYEDVIPKDLDKKATFDISVLASAVRRAAVLTNEESKGVRMNFTKSGVTITSRAPEQGEAEIKVPLEKFDGEGLEIGFNPAFITDVLKVLDTLEQVTFELKAPNRAGMIRAGTDFLYILMPVSLA